MPTRNRDERERVCLAGEAFSHRRVGCRNFNGRRMGSRVSGNASERLARFVVESEWDDVLQNVRHEAKRSLLNFFAAAVGGCRDEAINIAVDVLSGFAGIRDASVIGRAEKVDALTAAFLNAASGNVFDFDDTHIPTVIHPTAPVAPALFALAAGRRVSGVDLLHAFVLGVEIECRLGNVVSPGHYRRGWHITATCGVFGAAAAAGKLLALDAGRMIWGLGNASAQSSGLVETLGSMAKSIGVGNAARNGLLAALLAEHGFTGPDHPLEGSRGFVAVMGKDCDLSGLTNGLGETWEILRNTYKPYPCGVVLNPVIEGMLDLRRMHDLRPDQIQNIVVSGHPLLGERTDRPFPKSGREAQVSAQHSVAVALLHGVAGVAQYADAAVMDSATLALRAKVRVERDEAVPVGAARITIHLVNGKELTTFIEHARGSLERPMSDAELEQKLRMLAAHGSPGVAWKALADAIWSIEELSDVGDIMRHAVPARNS
jgi:2-methylcitrate dehydratase PrpD